MILVVEYLVSNQESPNYALSYHWALRIPSSRSVYVIYHDGEFKPCAIVFSALG